MDVTCCTCKTVSTIAEWEIPLGRSYFLCPSCQSRINIFKGLQPGALVTNLVGIRFMSDGSGLCEEYCEPGELWRVVNVTQPCPEKGHGQDCEVANKGRCPNQRLIMRLDRDKVLYRTCLYRKGRKIFDKTARTPVGVPPPFSPIDDDETYRIR